MIAAAIRKAEQAVWEACVAELRRMEREDADSPDQQKAFSLAAKVIRARKDGTPS